MLPQGADAAEPSGITMVSMTHAALALLGLLAAAPALAQGGLEPSGRLPPVATPPPPSSPKNATPVPLPAPMARGAVLEQVTGTVRDVDRKEHRIVVDTGGGAPVTLSLDRNTMVYTAAGLGTVLDVVPGAHIRAGRNADMVAYWVQVRPTAPPPSPAPEAATTTSGARASLEPAAAASAARPAPEAAAASPARPSLEPAPATSVAPSPTPAAR